MEKTRPGAKTRSAQAQRAKTLITVAAVAATVGGWVALSTAAPPTAAQTPATVAGAPLVPTPLPFGQSPGGRTRRGGLPSGSAQQPAFSNPAPGLFPAPSARTRSSR
ncbi:MAG: hypothetical protein M3Z04_09690 [Chloroflexota bacterium]|nr:hypothetical protein [Chloroflexota bacterium]